MSDWSCRTRRARALGAVGLAAAMLAACTVKPTRPVPGARLFDATAVDEQHGLLLFGNGLGSPGAPHAYLAKHDKDGPVAWVRSIDMPYYPDSDAAIRIVGDSALVVLAGPEAQSQALLRVPLDGGEPTRWTSTWTGSSPMIVWAAVGDATQVFVFWGAPRVEGMRTVPLEIAAFNQQTGERQWTRTQHVDPERIDDWAVRLADGWLMFSDAAGDWLLLRRSDGGRSPAIVADPRGMCEAHGRWWAQRGDHLLALDLDGDVATQRSTVAEFIASPGRHQWSLNHCGEHGDEVVVIVDQGPAGAGLLVGLEPATMQTRWTLALPMAVQPLIPAEGPTAATRFGDVALMGNRARCTVDLARRSVRQCGAPVHKGVMIADGEDTLLYNDVDHGMAFSLHRIGGADGEVKAAVEVRGAQDYERDDIWHHGLQLRDGMLWFNSHMYVEPDTTGALQHVVIDGRTLRPIERPMRDEQGALDPRPPRISVRDMMPELDTLLAKLADTGLKGKDEAPALQAIDPLVHWVSGGRPEDAVTPAPPRAGLYEELWAVARARGQLPADARIHVLAWRAVTGKYGERNAADEWVAVTGRRDDVLAVAEHHGPDGAVWVLINASSALGGDSPATGVRVFTRRPTEVDIHRFIGHELADRSSQLLDERDAPRGGAIDEAAWQAVIGASRVQRWLLPRPEPTRER